VAQKGGDGIGDSDHQQPKGEKVIAIIDTNGYGLAPLPVASVIAADTGLWPEGLQALKRVAKPPVWGSPAPISILMVALI